MSRELLAEERYEWIRTTLERLASIPHLNDEDFSYTVFEELDIDVRSCFHKTNLDRLGTAETVQGELLDLASSFLAIVDSVSPSTSSASAKTERQSDWVSVAERSERFLKSMRRSDFGCVK